MVGQQHPRSDRTKNSIKVYDLLNRMDNNNVLHPPSPASLSLQEYDTVKAAAKRSSFADKF
ncbi:hypothetical protein NIES4074_30400 [Cylindrospermum sp. NIES-4074]|nr:hypothetical protein NIES4074_30400 [Cylindrospermum sp. NIES-4074]